MYFDSNQNVIRLEADCDMHCGRLPRRHFRLVVNDLWHSRKGHHTPAESNIVPLAATFPPLWHRQNQASYVMNDGSGCAVAPLRNKSADETILSLRGLLAHYAQRAGTVVDRDLPTVSVGTGVRRHGAMGLHVQRWPAGRALDQDRRALVLGAARLRNLPVWHEFLWQGRARRHRRRERQLPIRLLSACRLGGPTDRTGVRGRDDRRPRDHQRAQGGQRTASGRLLALCLRRHRPRVLRQPQEPPGGGGEQGECQRPGEHGRAAGRLLELRRHHPSGVCGGQAHPQYCAGGHRCRHGRALQGRMLPQPRRGGRTGENRDCGPRG